MGWCIYMNNKCDYCGTEDIMYTDDFCSFCATCAERSAQKIIEFVKSKGLLKSDDKL